MNKISIRNGKFNVGHKGYYEQESQDFIEVVIVNASSVQRVYYEGEYTPSSPQAPVCWSSDTQQPDSAVTQKQSVHCMDCPHAIRGSAPNGGRACKFSQKLAVVFENDLWEVYQLQVPANSIFGRAQQGHMPLQEYAKFLSKNDTPALTVFTKIYFDRESTFPKLFFNPVRAAEKCELKLLQNIVGHPDSTEAITLNYNVMENEEMKYMIQNVTAQWPKLDRPYQYIEGSGTQPCSVDAEGAGYFIDINIPHAEAGKLRKAMKAHYDEKKAENDKKNPKNEWPEFEDGYEIVSEEGAAKEDRIYRKKCKLKAKYDTPTKKPLMLKANLQPCADDFQLTTGSLINIEVTFYAWANKAMGCGVSLRPQAVQVIKLEPRMERETSFTAVEGYGSDESEAGSSFTAVTSEPVKQEASNDDFGDEPEEPKKVAKKEKPSPKVKDDDEDLNAIIDDWGDDD